MHFYWVLCCISTYVHRVNNLHQAISLSISLSFLWFGAPQLLSAVPCTVHVMLLWPQSYHCILEHWSLLPPSDRVTPFDAEQRLGAKGPSQPRDHGGKHPRLRGHFVVQLDAPCSWVYSMRFWLRIPSAYTCFIQRRAAVHPLRFKCHTHTHTHTVL